MQFYLRFSTRSLEATGEAIRYHYHTTSFISSMPRTHAVFARKPLKGDAAIQTKCNFTCVLVLGHWKQLAKQYGIITTQLASSAACHALTPSSRGSPSRATRRSRQNAILPA